MISQHFNSFILGSLKHLASYNNEDFTTVLNLL